MCGLPVEIVESEAGEGLRVMLNSKQRLCADVIRALQTKISSDCVCS